MACQLCGIPIYSGSPEEILRIPSRYTQLTTVNLEFLYFSRVLQDFREALMNGTNVADGKWVQWLCRLRGISVPHLPGSRIIYDFLSSANEEGLTVLFLGSTKDVLADLRRLVEEKYPHIEGFYHDPGVVAYPVSEMVVENVGKLISEAQPHLLFVALGPPTQEVLIHRLRPYLEDAGTLLSMGVGGTFEMMVGVRKPAPRIVSSLGLEWLWHLIQKPSRIEKVKRSLKALGWCLR